MIFKISQKAQKQINKLPEKIKVKTNKSIKLLLSDIRHPSLKCKKMAGQEKYEARIDYHYRFTFIFEDDDLLILSVGTHDTGLGKK